VLTCITGACLLTACTAFKESTQTIGHATKDITASIGHGVRDSAKAISKNTKEVVDDIKDGSDSDN